MQAIHGRITVSFVVPRFVRRLRVVILRFVRRSLREESPLIDRLAPDVEDRSGFGPISFR